MAFTFYTKLQPFQSNGPFFIIIYPMVVQCADYSLIDLFKSFKHCIQMYVHMYVYESFVHLKRQKYICLVAINKMRETAKEKKIDGRDEMNDCTSERLNISRLIETISIWMHKKWNGFWIHRLRRKYIYMKLVQPKEKSKMQLTLKIIIWTAHISYGS